MRKCSLLHCFYTKMLKSYCKDLVFHLILIFFYVKEMYINKHALLIKKTFVRGRHIEITEIMVSFNSFGITHLG